MLVLDAMGRANTNISFNIWSFITMYLVRVVLTEQLLYFKEFPFFISKKSIGQTEKTENVSESWTFNRRRNIKNTSNSNF